MKCYICEQNFKKLAKAHLLPEGLKKITGEFSGGDGYLIKAPLDRPGTAKIQTLDFDREILCADCDNSLAEFDEEFIKFAGRWAKSEHRELCNYSPNGNPFVSIPCDASALKVGIAISLYRCSISKRCSAADIGEKYEKIMSKILQTRSRRPVISNFSVKFMAVFEGPHGTDQILANPYKTKVSQRHIHITLVYGLIVLAMFGNRPWPKEFERLPSLTENDSHATIGRSLFKDSLYQKHLSEMLNTQKK